MAVASSGIAALLLTGGRTAHSRFKIPIHLHEASTCEIKVQSKYAELYKNTDLVIWDEAPMTHKFAFEALDRCFRDIMGCKDEKLANYPFGNKVIVFGGDFRQVLPVVQTNNRSDIVNSSINRSSFWGNVVKLHLTVNMTLLSYDMNLQQREEAQAYSYFILSVGEGKQMYKDIIDKIEIPKQFSVKLSKLEFVKFVFPSLETGQLNLTAENKAIITPKNNEADELNRFCTELFPGEVREFLSADSVLDPSQAQLYPLEYLNSLHFGGLPPHCLRLQLNMPIILLRNLSPSDGLCNGTRLIVTQFHSRLIEAKIIFGKFAGKKV